MNKAISITLGLLLIGGGMGGCAGREQEVEPDRQPTPSIQSEAIQFPLPGPTTPAAPVKQQPANKVILDAPLIKQNPELKYGCEVTSLTMLLQHAGVKVGKLELADKMPKDQDNLHSQAGDITHWGNPDHGFVGDVTGKSKGYAIYAKPMENLARQYLGERIVNLTGGSFEDLLNRIRSGKPVVVWTTAHFSPPRKWEFWKHGDQQIKATIEEHAVLLVGFDPAYVYVNDPLTGRKAQKVPRQPFIQAWQQLGSQALSYK